jgi:hypothetical protein
MATYTTILAQTSTLDSDNILAVVINMRELKLGCFFHQVKVVIQSIRPT